MVMAECWLRDLWPLPEGIRVGWRAPGVTSDAKLVVRGDGEILGRFYRTYWRKTGSTTVMRAEKADRKGRAFPDYAPKRGLTAYGEAAAVRWILEQAGYVVDWPAYMPEERA